MGPIIEKGFPGNKPLVPGTIFSKYNVDVAAEITYTSFRSIQFFELNT